MTKFGLSVGAARGIRTPDPIITNDVLYRLSYCGVARGDNPRAAALQATGEYRRQPRSLFVSGESDTRGRRPRAAGAGQSITYRISAQARRVGAKSNVPAASPEQGAPPAFLLGFLPRLGIGVVIFVAREAWVIRCMHQRNHRCCLHGCGRS
jgi:hypothetical protein